MLYTFKFAIGRGWATPNGGLQPTNASGTELQTIHNFSIDFAGKGVDQRGQFLYAQDARVADIEAKGKFEVGGWNLEQLNNLFYAGTVTETGNVIPYGDELHTIPSSGPYTVTVTNTPGFVQPLTVAYASTLSNFDEVTAGPTAGQYTCNDTSGQFTFSSADAGEQVLISYVASGTGAALAIPNNLQGQSPVVQLTFVNPADGSGIIIPSCRVNSIKPVDLKNNAYDNMQVEFMAFCPFGQTSIATLLQLTF
jgi:hypothetical protein